MKNFYRYIVFTALVSLAAQSSFAAHFNIDPAHSSINFTIKHMVSKVNGHFNSFTGDFNFDPKKPADSNAQMTIQTASISTDNDKRDTHLKSPDFFDAAKFPTITFKSKKLEAHGKDKYKLTGDFTMHGVTKEVSFDVEFGGIAKDPMGNTRAGFTAIAKVNRKDFGIIWNKALDSGGYLLGDDVAVTIQIEGIQAADSK